MLKLTVEEYSKREGISPQAVYKKIEKGQLKIVEERRNDNRKVKYILIEEAPFDPVQPNSTDDQPFQPNSTDNQPTSTDNSTEEEQPIQPNSTEKDDLINLLKAEIEAKNRQIEALQEQARTQAETHKTEIENLHRLFDQEQQLHALALKQLPPPKETEEEQTEQKKKGLFKRLFKSKEKRE